MPRVGPVYTLPAGYLAVNGETILPSQHNPPLEDIAGALTDSLPRNGTGPMTGELAMGSNKITGLAAGTNPSDAARFDQIGASSAWLTSVSALTPAADEMVYANGTNTAAKTGLSAFMRTVLDDANQAAALTTLGAQPADADLTAVAALASTGIAVRTASNTWAQRTITSTDTSVTITNPGGVAGNIDLSVPASGSVLLGTIATTSGTSPSLGSLTLTPYKFLRFVVSDVSVNSGTAVPLEIAGDQCAPANGGAAFMWKGIIDLDLSTGHWSAMINSSTTSNGSAQGEIWAGDSPYSTATTSVVFSAGGTTFDAGSILVYGVA